MHNINTIAVVMTTALGLGDRLPARFYNNRNIGAHVLSPRFDEVMKLCGGNGYFVRRPGHGAGDQQAMTAQAGGDPTSRSIRRPWSSSAKTH